MVAKREASTSAAALQKKANANEQAAAHQKKAKQPQSSLTIYVPKALPIQKGSWELLQRVRKKINFSCPIFAEATDSQVLALSPKPSF